MPIGHIIMREFKNNKIAGETEHLLYGHFYGQSVITGRQVRNLFLKFHTGDTSLRDKSRSVRLSSLD